MYAGGIDQDDLPGFAALLMRRLLCFGWPFDDSKNAVARRLRLGRNNREFLPDQRIEQRALAGIGTAKDADETGVKGHEYRLLVLAIGS